MTLVMTVTLNAQTEHVMLTSYVPGFVMVFQNNSPKIPEIFRIALIFLTQETQPPTTKTTVSTC